MPKPSISGMIFNIVMLFASFFGFIIYGAEGFIIGLLIGSIGLFLFFFGRKQRGFKCQICDRPIINLEPGTPFANKMNVGVFLSVSDMRAGLEGPGTECLRCGRVYCSNCTDYDLICKCSSQQFRTVRLKYK